MRNTLLKSLYKFSPFDPAGDCLVPPACDGIKISCVINFYGRLDLLSGILFSLAEQDLSHDLFEVVLIEDRGGTDAGGNLAQEFGKTLPVRYSPLDKNYGFMGYSRNHGLAFSRGEYILFLDDDTVILQDNFLRILLNKFEADPTIDGIIPKGQASFALLKDRYDYHDHYFMTNRCMAYRRTVLTELHGFMSDFVGQEDVEFSIRYTMTGKTSIETPELNYCHPPLLIDNLQKPMAVGMSFYGIKGRYPFLIWLLALANGSRHAPLLLLPSRKFQEMGKFGMGFMAGVLNALLGKKKVQYQSS